MAAVAASECGEEADMVREAAGDWLREVLLGGEAWGEGGRVFRSGGMAGSGVMGTVPSSVCRQASALVGLHVHGDVQRRWWGDGGAGCHGGAASAPG